MIAAIVRACSIIVCVAIVGCGGGGVANKVTPTPSSDTPDDAAPPDGSATPDLPTPPPTCDADHPCAITVEKQGPFQDPSQYFAGWTSAHYAELGDGRRCILYLFGNGHTTPENSIRCLDTSTGTFTYAQVETEDANHQISGDGINGRDNHLSLSIPGRGLLVTGGAYLNGKPYTSGFFDYKQIKWTYRDDIYSLFIAPPGFAWATFNPVMTWSSELDVGFVYGGTDGPAPSNHITLVKPRSDGKFDLVPLNDDPQHSIPDTPACTFSRNNGVAVGEWVYVAGGRCKVDPNKPIEDVAWFRRFNLNTHVWEKLQDVPDAIRLPQVTYDARSGFIIFYGGNGHAGLQEGDPGYWDGRNEVYIWNVVAGGPWLDITKQADMPSVQMPNGAYDPNTGWNCYRPGKVFPATTSTAINSQVNCLRLDVK